MSDDERMCIDTLRSIWSFVASSIRESEGMTRDVLLELLVLLLDCTVADCAINLIHDRLIASVQHVWYIVNISGQHISLKVYEDFAEKIL